MDTLRDQRVLLCVSAGIAAYKCCEVVRRLKEAGAEVQVVMTERATHFVTPLTFQALSGKPVRTSLFDAAAEAAMSHIELARWATVVLLAPATADLLARLAAGIADDLVTTVCLASSAPVLAAPAMNQQMWQHAATQANLQTLRDRGVRMIGPDAGAQACGEVGPGRMVEAAVIVAAVIADAVLTAPSPFANARQPAPPPGAHAARCLAGRNVLITAGPTRESIDPVRYISNHSTGKQGFALAAAAQAAGASVTLVAGPVTLATPPGVRRIDVESALEMHAAVLTAVPEQDLFIAVAAVADYRPDRMSATKIKKTGSAAPITLTLTENPDIVAAVAALTVRPFILGFAAETDRVLDNGREKRRRKHLDAIAVNDVAAPGIGFQSDENAVTLIWDGGEQSLPRAPKAHIATQLIEAVAALMAARNPQPRIGDRPRDAIQ